MQESERQSVVSARGMGISEFPRPEFMETYLEHSGKKTVVNFAMAENRLSKGIVMKKLHEAGDGLQEGSLSYADYSGEPVLREALSVFMDKYMGKGEGAVRPSDLTVLNGAGSVLVQLAYCLTDPTDAVLSPGPLYYGFNRDLCAYSGAVLVTLNGRDPLSLPVLKKAFKEAKDKGNTPRVIVIANPGNPTGAVVEQFVLRSVAQWAAEHNMHVILDEVYALSVFRSSPYAFRSGAAIWDTLPQNVHIVWGLSKDFCASGLRCACLYTRNEQVSTAVRKFAYFYQVSRPLQYQVAAMLSDHAWVDSYLQTMRGDLLAACNTVEEALRSNDVEFMPPQAAFFVWCNFASTCKAAGGELAFIKRLAAEGVLLVNGKACNAEEEGWFRLCFASCTTPDLKLGLERIFKVCNRIDEDSDAKL